MEKIIEIKEPDETAVGNSTDMIRVSNITSGTSGIGLVLVDPVKKFGVGAYLVLATRTSKQIAHMLSLLIEKGTAEKHVVEKVKIHMRHQAVIPSGRISYSKLRYTAGSCILPGNARVSNSNKPHSGRNVNSNILEHSAIVF
jgi:hypothetical protein